jgi:hypothetical protein
MMMSVEYDRMHINDTLFKNRSVFRLIHCSRTEAFFASSFFASSFFASSPVVKQLLVFALRQTGFGEERQTDVHAKRASRENAR